MTKIVSKKGSLITFLCDRCGEKKSLKTYDFNKSVKHFCTMNCFRHYQKELVDARYEPEEKSTATCSVCGVVFQVFKQSMKLIDEDPICRDCAIETMIETYGGPVERYRLIKSAQRGGWVNRRNHNV